MTKDDDTQDAPRQARRDPNTLSAPEQQEVQQLQTERAAAEARGDKQAVKDIDARLKQLTDPK